MKLIRLAVIYTLFFITLCNAAPSMLPEKSWYQVEIIIFSQPAKQKITEKWANPFLETIVQPKEARWQTPLWLDSDAQQLQTTEQQLRSQGYDILSHQVWQQNVERPALASEIEINNQDTLRGYLRLSQTNYINAELNVYVQRDNYAQTIKLHQTARLRPDELHYFDHPKLGVLLLVSQNAETISLSRPVQLLTE